MITVTQSPFLQALGYAIVNSLWQFAFVWLVYFLINCLLKLSSHQKYTAALLLQLSGFAWFIFTLVFYYKQCAAFSTNFNVVNQYSLDILSSTESSVKDKLFAGLIKAEQFLPYLSIAYLLLLIFLSAKWLHSYRYTQQIKVKGLSKINVDWRLFVQRLSVQLGIGRKVNIYLSDIVKAPLTIGFFKPIILIPLASINHLNIEQMEAVILHELAHIKRLDYLVNLLISVIEATMFFNPFMQLLSKHIKRERENSCDDWVLQYEYSAATYARALLKIASFQTSQPSFAMKAAENKNVLLIRVKRIIEKNEKSFHYRHQLIALLFITVLLSSIAWLAPNKNKLVKQNISHVKIEPIAAKVDNPLFNPVFFLADKDKEKLSIDMDKEKKQAEKHLKAIALSNLPIAIPEKNSGWALDEIAPPTIKNPTQLAKNSFVVAPRFVINLDTLLFNKNIKKLLSSKVVAEIQKTERDARRALTLSAKRREMDQELAALNEEKVIEAMKVALYQIKATKAKLMQLTGTLPTSLTLTTSGLSSAYSNVTTDEDENDEEDVDVLNEQINTELKEVQQQYAMLANLNINVESGAVEIPAVARYFSAPHSYSYEYSNAPKTKVVNSAITITRENKKLKGTIDSDDEDTQSNLVAPPTAPSTNRAEKGKIYKAKKLNVIVHI